MKRAYSLSNLWPDDEGSNSDVDTSGELQKPPKRTKRGPSISDDDDNSMAEDQPSTLTPQTGAMVLHYKSSSSKVLGVAKLLADLKFAVVANYYTHIYELIRDNIWSTYATYYELFRSIARLSGGAKRTMTSEQKRTIESAILLILDRMLTDKRPPKLAIVGFHLCIDFVRGHAQKRIVDALVHCRTNDSDFKRIATRCRLSIKKHFYFLAALLSRTSLMFRFELDVFTVKMSSGAARLIMLRAMDRKRLMIDCTGKIDPRFIAVPISYYTLSSITSLLNDEQHERLLGYFPSLASLATATNITPTLWEGDKSTIDCYNSMFMDDEQWARLQHTRFIRYAIPLLQSRALETHVVAEIISWLIPYSDIPFVKSVEMLLQLKRRTGFQPHHLLAVD